MYKFESLINWEWESLEMIKFISLVAGKSKVAKIKIQNDNKRVQFPWKQRGQQLTPRPRPRLNLIIARVFEKRKK